MVSPDDVATSKAIQQRTGKTFHVATRVLPKRVRRATYVLYAFFRVADEVVDDPDGTPPEEQRRELERIREAALGERETDDPVLSAFADLKDEYDIPDCEVETFVDAMEMDVDTRRYDTYADLEEYLRGSSVAVAYMMLAVMAGGEEMSEEEVETARPHAKALGEAFQLTNFLRDVREDVRDYGRIYLPGATLAQYGVPVDDVHDCRYSEGFAAAMRAELRRTERLYRKGVRGIQYLPEDCRFAVLLAAVLYAEHHRLIRERDFDTLSERPTLTMRRRLALVAITWYHWKRTGDPVEAFVAASAVPPTGAEHEGEDTRQKRRSDGRVTEGAGAVTGKARNAAGSLISLFASTIR